jgi:hypothetical protein
MKPFPIAATAFGTLVRISSILCGALCTFPEAPAPLPQIYANASTWLARLHDRGAPLEASVRVLGAGVGELQRRRVGEWAPCTTAHRAAARSARTSPAPAKAAT